MSRPGLAFGLNLANNPGTRKPPLARRKPVFGGDDDDSDNDGANDTTKDEDVGGELDFDATTAAGELLACRGLRSKSKAPTQPPKLKAKSNPFQDRSSTLASRKVVEAATESDPNVYEYDAVYDSLKHKKYTAKETTERKPRYMQSLMQAAEVRKRDALIAEEKKIAREREAEGDEFADKEKLVTEAYKKQQQENRRLKEEERRREEEEAKKNKGGGMSAFYRRLLDKGEERHAEVLRATQESAKDGPISGDDQDEDEDRDKVEAALARELNEKGVSVAVNEDGQVVDKRQLLKGGLNVGAREKKSAQREAERPRQGDHRHPISAQANRKQGMRERQSRMLEEKLEQSMKRSKEAEEAQRQDLERSAKSRKTEGEISSARERYLARKRAAEETKSKGLEE